MKEDMREVYSLKRQDQDKNLVSASKSLYIRAQAYFVKMREQHTQLMENSIKKYRNAEDFAEIANALTLVQGPLQYYQVPNLRARSVFLMGRLFGLAIQYELQNMSMKERIRYSRIHRQSLQLLSQGKQKLAQHFINCEIMSLLCQDILSLILLEGQRYQKFCSSRIPLFFTEDISNLLPFFKKEYIKKIGKYFQKSQLYITCEGLSQHIVQLVKLLTLILIRFRIISIALKTPAHSLLNAQSFSLIREMYALQRLEMSVKNTGNQYEYYLSEISIFMYLDQITSIPSHWKSGIINLLSEVAKIPIIEDRKWLILKTKIRYNLSFGTLLQYLNFLEKNGENEAYRLIMAAKSTKQNLWKFFFALPYIFLMNDSIQNAFQRRGFNKEFNIAHGNEGIVKCSSYIKGLIMISASFRGAEYGQQTLKQLKLQKKKAKIIVIKKYQFTYNEMRSQFTTQSQKDFPITLILGTVDRNILFYQLFFSPLQQNAFIACLQSLIRRLKLSYPFVISIHAYHDYNPMSRGSLAALLQLTKTFKTRVYISNVDEECSFNTMLFAYLYSRLIRKSSYSHEIFIENFSRDFDDLIYRISKYQQKRIQFSSTNSKEI